MQGRDKVVIKKRSIKTNENIYFRDIHGYYQLKGINRLIKIKVKAVAGIK